MDSIIILRGQVALVVQYLVLVLIHSRYLSLLSMMGIRKIPIFENLDAHLLQKGYGVKTQIFEVIQADHAQCCLYQMTLSPRVISIG